MSYVLESDKEFERLERQSQNPNYDYHRELEGFLISPQAKILDSGCGSGVVCRYLAKSYPDSTVTGCDLAQDRIELAQGMSSEITNLSFLKADLTKLPFASNSFHVVICRYVLHHLHTDAKNTVVLRELFRVLKPGGRLLVIDADGLLTALYPQPPLVASTLDKLVQLGPVDLHIGRKLPSMFLTAGFESIDWRVIPFDPSNAGMAAEVPLMRERLEAAKGLFVKLLNSEQKADRFIESYLAALQAPGATYFQSKFVVSGIKPNPMKMRVVK